MGKSTKVLNPADKARREARKKELKKNKKQRQQVRSSVIEKKDPEQIIADLEKLDRFEYDVSLNSSMSDTQYKEKRKRLKETFTKILEYYSKEDPERHASLQKLEKKYENDHAKLVRDYEAIKAATEVTIDDIFLPPESDSLLDEIADDDPLMLETMYIIPTSDCPFKPPGCPPGVPPDLGAVVKNLSAPIIAPMQPLPPELMNFGLVPHGLPPATFNAKPRTRNPSQISRFSNRSQPSIGQRPGPKNLGPRPTQVDFKGAKPVKPAVIESKPVIFMPKATKFVPAAVRSKLKQVDGSSKTS